MMAAPERASEGLRAFAARGRRIDYDGNGVFAVDGGTVHGPSVVFLHGFPGSSFDYARTMDMVGERCRVLALDFPGYGLSDKSPEMSMSLFEYADAVEVMLASAGVARAHVVAHDMGTSVALELCARHRLGLLSFKLASVLFTNGSVFIEMSRLTPSQKLLRIRGLNTAFAKLASFRAFRFQIDRTTGRRLSDEAAQDMFALMTAGGGRNVLPALVRYIDERYRFAERWVGHLGALDVPTTVFWGQRDTVAIPAIGERLAHELPSPRVVRLDDVGHFTPLEAPEELAEATLELVARASP